MVVTNTNPRQECRMKRYLKRLSELRYRISNFRYGHRKGLPIRRAWKKADLTL